MFDFDDEINDFERDKLIEEGRLLEELIATKGWQLLEKEIDNRIEMLKMSLVIEKDMNDIIRHQEAVKWGLALKNYIKTKIANGKVLLEQKTREEQELS